MQALVKGGVIGAVLAWALLKDYRNTERMFEVIDKNTTAIAGFTAACVERAVLRGD